MFGNKNKKIKALEKENSQTLGFIELAKTVIEDKKELDEFTSKMFNRYFKNIGTIHALKKKL